MEFTFLLKLGLTFLLSWGISLWLTPRFRRIALRFRFVDRPEERKIHRKVITRLGGGAIYVSFWSTVGALFFLKNLPPRTWAIFLTSLPLFFLGVVDDTRGVKRRWVKLLVQFITASCLIFLGVRVNKIASPFFETKIILSFFPAYFLSLLWILTLTNAINFADGLDGLAAGICCIGTFVLFGAALRIGARDIALLFLALLGATFGFLKYNFHPAKVFMGDAGSTFLGFSLAGISLMSTLKSPTTISLFVPLVLLGFPVVDTSFAVVRRLLRGKSPFLPDKAHLHHRLLKRGLSHPRAVLFIYGITIILGIIALFLVQKPTFTTVSFIFILLGILGIVFYRWRILRGK